MSFRKLLKASAYYLEDALSLDLNERLKASKLSFLLLNQPPVCDYNCRRCFMPSYRRSLGTKNALGLEECKRILSDAKAAGVLCLEISGEGEPLLSKNIVPIIKYANSLGLMTTLITNGNNLTEGQIRIFRESNVTLVFSLHTLDKEKYELDNQCNGSFQKKISIIRKASEIYAGTKTWENDFEVYRIAIHATLQKDNIKEVERLRKFCKKLGIFFSIAPLALAGNATAHPEIQLNPKNSLESVFLKGDNSIIHSHSSARVFGREVCGTAFYGLNIGYDGAILFDCHYGYEIGEKNLLGNIRIISFLQAVKNQGKYSSVLFNNIKGVCPVRDPKGKEFLEEFISGKIKAI